MDLGETRAADAASTEPGLSPAMADGFASLIYGRSAGEDRAHYAGEGLDQLALSAWQHLAAPRVPGEARIRLLDAEVQHAGRRRAITVLEVVNDDMPFLLDSTLAELGEEGREPLLVAHPIVDVVRGPDRAVTRFVGAANGPLPAGVERESLIQIHLPRMHGQTDRDRLTEALGKVYADVAHAVGDFKAMRARVKDAARDYRGGRAKKLPLPDDEAEEAGKFLRWLVDDNFTLLGTRHYRYPEGNVAADPVEGSGLGILRDPDVRVLKRGNELVTMTPELRAFLLKPVALIISKANVKSRVRRRVHLDYIGVKLFDEQGRLEGELRIVGLFASNVYTRAASELPYLGHKVARVMALAGFDPQSYSGRALLHVLDTYPRDEMFQIDADALHGFALELLKLTERPRVRALVRVDEFDRFVSVLVFVPKDHYDTSVRIRIGELLADVFKGQISASYPAYPEGPLTRTQYIIGRSGGATPKVDTAELETRIGAIVQTWSDALADLAEAELGSDKAHEILARYGGQAFSAGYREGAGAEVALADIRIIEGLSAHQPRAVDIYRRAGDPDHRANLKVFTRSKPMPLSERVPLLENLGFQVVNERTFRVFPAGVPEDGRVWLHDMTLERPAGEPIDLVALTPLLEEALTHLFAGAAESDRFNTLIVEARLPWRDAAVLRAYGRYLQQIGTTYAQSYIAAALIRHSAIAGLLVELFHARFRPTDEAPRPEEGRLRGEVEARLADVASLDDDQILRRFLNLIGATLRTNVYQRDAAGGERRTIAFKIASREVDQLPLPRPLYEIWVYSPQVEGVHLRFGKVARGGLRWSDRPQDFRTEVLGLVKAQQVKNAVIVPVGAKGGFFPKRLPPASDRQAWMAEGVASYKTFVSTLLDLTDNIVGDAIAPPAVTVRHDGDDPYLVVAADKGTATFSDIANGLSAEHHHWLGDAFASGGSQGYDHKKMGITARGAWEAVKRHFRELDVDIQAEPVTVVGVGDMSGDVFGNGMLLSRAIKLIAAFDHRDIFIDPDPNAEAAFTERQRLFDLPRSSWQDYDRNRLSAGGGVFSRQLKSIPLSPQARAALGIARAEGTPQEIINAILKAPADLLWFGGIGTYVKASEESNESVGDKANDAIRVSSAELRCKAIGEGANLGVTQRGRIEAARQAVRLNSDAIDNSAGVNTSDVEVNIKIALAGPVRDGRLAEEARNALLVDMTDEVAALVLRNNYLQTLAISLAQRGGAGEIGFARRQMQTLEQAGRLDRAVENLPDDAALAAREERGEPLTRPELAVLLAYAKLDLYDQILDSAVLDEAYLARELSRYFPPQLVERFPADIAAHRLRREIIATQLANAIVNRGGATIVTRLVDQTGADAATIVRAYAAVNEVYRLDHLNADIDALDGRIEGQRQLALYAEVQELLIGRMIWFIRNVDFAREDLAEIIALYRDGVAAVAASLAHTLPAAERQDLRRRVAALAEAGVSSGLAEDVGAISSLDEAPEIVRIARRAGADIAEVAATHFAVAGSFGLEHLTEAARQIAVGDYYDRLALGRAVDAIAAAHRRLTAEVLADGGRGADGVAAWAQRRGSAVDRIRATVDGIASSGLSLSKLTVAASLMGDLSRG
ncbi:NAD-glutamate dehydrogenase [Chelatococcus reniformis]|uniref:NAD-glutamate dehydrogenase n=1 Tax=Chelatococcus reniformis TaxID=1494448 RepID=A0A916TXL0_9HYPH|nr:NAD-glutamate dehydrogenase [Chelatococcus reniformis]GGC50453.1 NAD-glutamate dehydrogenase [Chelatococcus reniformis]